MFDVSLWELMIIGLIALIVVGPERLPGVARTIGLWVGRARATLSSLRDEVERESHIQGLRDTERALRERGREMREGVERGASQARSDINKTRGDIESAAKSAQASDKADGGDAPSAESAERERDGTGQ